MADGRQPPIAYRLEVRGRLPIGVAEELPGFTVEMGPDRTRLSGPVADTSALYGLIARLETLGLTLLSVHADAADHHVPEGS
jgi:hypothetical protein